LSVWKKNQGKTACIDMAQGKEEDGACLMKISHLPGGRLFLALNQGGLLSLWDARK
jgi:hypothetical protein